MSKLSLTVRIDGKPDQYLVEILETSTVRDLKNVLVNVMGKALILLHVFTQNGPELADMTVLNTSFGAVDTVRVTIDGIKVFFSQTQAVKYEIDPQHTTGIDLRQMVSTDVGVQLYRVRLFLGATELNNGILGTQRVTSTDNIYLLLRKPKYLVQEIRLLDRFTPKTSVPFQSMGKNSTAPVKILGPVVDSLDKALSMIGRNISMGMPEYDEVTNSYHLYSNGSIQYRAMDIGEYVLE